MAGGCHLGLDVGPLGIGEERGTLVRAIDPRLMAPQVDQVVERPSVGGETADRCTHMAVPDATALFAGNPAVVPMDPG